MKLNRFATFHPHIHEKTKVVNRTLVHFLRGDNQNHPTTKNENLAYLQHSYNIASHTSIGNFPFETCFGYFPSSSLDFAYVK